MAELNHAIPLPTDPAYDGPIAKRNTDRTLMALAGQQWWTVQRLAIAIGATETSASSALRDLRKEKYGAHNIVRRRKQGGISEYRLFPNGYMPAQGE